MKSLIPSPRTIEILVGLLATALITTGLLLYTWQEPDRIASAQQDQLNADLDEAMNLYAENCAVCHGLAGEGIGTIPALDNPALRTSEYVALEKIIARGLYGTAMPAWSQLDGGPLNDYQIGELVTLIQAGDWQATQDRVVNLGLAPRVPFATEPDLEILTAVSGLPDGDLLTRGITVYAQQCVACHGSDGLGTNLAPALNDPSVRAQAPGELENTVLNGVSGTLMSGWENTLSDEELAALIHLMLNWEQVPSGAIPEPDRPIPVTEASLALGSELYTSSCARCHGPEGQGTPRAPSLNVKGFLEETSDLAVEQIVTLGVPGTSMPAWGDRLTEAEIQAIVGFIRSWEPTAPEVAEPARGGGGPWWQTQNGSSGGQSSGPPWMRNSTVSPSGQGLLPSGGSQTGQAASHASGTAAGAANHTPGSGPSWAAASEPTTWWQKLDSRVGALLGGTALASALFITTGLVGLARYNGK